MVVRYLARIFKRFTGGSEQTPSKVDAGEFKQNPRQEGLVSSDHQDREERSSQTAGAMALAIEADAPSATLTEFTDYPADTDTEESLAEQANSLDIGIGKQDQKSISQPSSVQIDPTFNVDDVVREASDLDASLTEFIRSQVASTRLVNCSRAEYLATTTLRTALSDRDAVERECLKLSNFGRRTLNELNALLDAAVNASRTTPDPSASMSTHPSAFHLICGLFENTTLNELCAVRPISVRLANGIASFPLKNEPLGHLFSDWPSVRQELRRQKNMGAKSIEELQELCLDLMATYLSRNDIPDPASRKIAGSILKQEGMPKDLEYLAVTALADALPFSANALVEEEIQHPEVAAERLLSLLDERSKDVVSRRFGFNDTGIETLEQIAQSYGVTRERIRQLEAKALRKLQIVGKSLPLKAALLEYGDDLWLALAGSKGFVGQIDITVTNRIPASFKLLLTVCEWQLENWLDARAIKWGTGWIPNGADIEALDDLRWKIADTIEGKALPRPIPADIVGLGAHTLGMVIDLQFGLKREGFYILPTGTGQQTARRAARLHGSLKRAMAPHTSNELAATLSQTSRKDDVSNRYAIMVASRYPHLFIEGDDDEWFAVGTPTAFSQISPEFEVLTNNNAEVPETDGFTMAAFLTEILARTGPMRLTDLQAEAVKNLPPDRSPASIGPTLLMHREIFDRALPGVYAVRGSIPLGRDLIGIRPAYLLNAEQARLFAMGRRAGEPWGAYPLWTCEAEYLLCSWARKNAEPALLDSLLAVASFDLWPVDDAARTEWKTFADQKKRIYQLHFQPRAEVGYALPKADRLLAACLEARHTARFDWMVGNRILNKMADSHMSAGLIVLMVALGALQIDAAGNWQMPHRCGPKLDELIQRLSGELHDQGKLSWNCEVGRQILVEIDVASTTTGNWIDAHLLSAMLSSAPVEDDEDVEIDLEELNQLIAAEAGTLGWEADEVATAPQQDRDTAIGSDYRAMEVARTRVVSDQDGEWTLDDIAHHSGG